MIRYTKLEGCGNDFVVVDLRRGEAAPQLATPEAAEAVCDRHYGVGADGVLAILPPSIEGAVARMRVLNADGSEAEMCGNGIRCVAKYLYERDAAARQPVIPVETGAGLLACGVTLDARRHVTHVSVEMGRPRLGAAEIPVEPAAFGAAPTGTLDALVERPLTVEGRAFPLTMVSMGNPHAVTFVDGDEPLRALAERFGPRLETHAAFPRRANIEFARLVGPRHLELVVWERGCGITLACGTGACATAVAAHLTRRAPAGEELRVSLPGGDLFITVEAGLGGVTMRGPADEVFEGELDLAPLLSRHRARHDARHGSQRNAHA